MPFSSRPRLVERLSTNLVILSFLCPFFPMVFECYLLTIHPLLKNRPLLNCIAWFSWRKGTFFDCLAAHNICSQRRSATPCINFMLFPAEVPRQGSIRQPVRTKLTNCFWKNEPRGICYEPIQWVLVFAYCGIYVVFFSQLLNKKPRVPLSQR